jgi:hypothetical protein
LSSRLNLSLFLPYCYLFFLWNWVLNHVSMLCRLLIMQDILFMWFLISLFFMWCSSWPLAYLGKYIPVPVRPLQAYFKPIKSWRRSRRGGSPWSIELMIFPLSLFWCNKLRNQLFMQTRSKVYRHRPKFYDQPV